MIEIYYMEDDEELSQMTGEFFEQCGYKISVFQTVHAVRQALQSRRPTLVLVGWNQPDGTGDELCRWIRERWADLPLLLLIPDFVDSVSACRSGADDYIVKPFELDELHSHILALLQKAGEMSKQYLSCGGIMIDQRRKLVFYKTEAVSLSAPEYQMLLYLMQNRGQTVTRDKLLEIICEIRGGDVDKGAVTVTMKWLREKLHRPSCIKTVRGVGYRMDCEA